MNKPKNATQPNPRQGVKENKMLPVKNTDKFLGKVICTADSVPCVLDWEEFETEAEAKAFVRGFELAKEQSCGDDHDSLEEYHACQDQHIPMIEV